MCKYHGHRNFLVPRLIIRVALPPFSIRFQGMSLRAQGLDIFIFNLLNLSTFKKKK